jgi:hypothetical protein
MTTNRLLVVFLVLTLGALSCSTLHRIAEDNTTYEYIVDSTALDTVQVDTVVGAWDGN